jgi:predicted nucleotidyltransferase
MDCMKPSEALRTNRDALGALAEQHHLSNLRVFGSVAMGADDDESDLDLLVDAPPGATLFHLGGFLLPSLTSTSIWKGRAIPCGSP